MEGYTAPLQKIWRRRATRLVLVMVALVFAVVTVQNTALTFRTSSSSLLSIFRTSSLPKGPRNPTETEVPNVAERSNKSDEGDSSGDDIDLGDDDEAPDEEFEIDVGNGTVLRKAEDGHITIERGSDTATGKGGKPGDGSGFTSSSFTNSTLEHGGEVTRTPLVPPPPLPPSPSVSTIPIPTVGCKLPEPKRGEKARQIYSISDMNRMLLQNRANPCSMVPRWPSAVDQQILDAKAQIDKAPIVKDDPELYAPAFRNVSMFKRSYELMEQILKVYVYKEGGRPIFHKPFLTGIYAAEGWFMKHMEENTHFLVDDPNKAHLFYMPFSSRTLREVMHPPGSRGHKDMVKLLKNYVMTISAQYPFWNRTGGADHFLAACHDWAPRETQWNMEAAIRALCNANVRRGFVLGKDVAFPTTNVRSALNPLEGVGGKAPRKRTTLAFFAGQMHGYLRPILMRHWENRDPDMKFFGSMPRYGAATVKKGNRARMVNLYVDYMKDSKYCICPRGYEVNSPRVMEAIFYECVPVIISDNYVPPLFEVLDWGAFSVVLPEKDVPRLKEILVSIPRKRYERLQLGVRRVQKHFLWNKSPVKYDLFHMTLHSVWLNRLHQFRAR